jgi:hypothetical protein
VATFADQEPDGAGRYGAALLFVAWSEGAEKPLGHLETEYLAFGTTPEEASAAILALTLHEIKAHLDRCVANARTP